jgi:urease accessory protein
MITLTEIVGFASDPWVAERLHELAHHDAVEHLTVGAEDMSRRRLRGTTDKGTEVAVALGQSDRLSDGAVLLIGPARAIVVRAVVQRWLRIVPRDVDAAIAAGYCAGNQHWRVQFEAGAMLVAMEGPSDSYVAQLEGLARDGRIEVTGP